jgi:prepilin-type N-terminal cleavage/methylation domain-containing protein
MMNRKEKLEVRSSKFENGSPISASKSSTFDFPIYNLRVNTRHAFTLLELLASMAVLALLVLLFARLLSSAAAITTLGHKRMDADSQARQLLDRMQLDFDQMLKRTDVSYYVKINGAPAQTGNDQIAFFSSVPGYYSQTDYNSGIALVSYRVNNVTNPTITSSYNRLERMGKQLPLNGGYVGAGSTPLLFLNPTNPADPTTATTLLTNTTIWPAAATNTTSTDPNYELIGPQVFRFEYYYLLTTGALSAGPWLNVPSFSVKDVAAIVVDIAVLDPKSKVLLNNAQVTMLTGTLADYTSGWAPGQLLSTWQTTVNTNAANLPRAGIQGVRFYERYFYLSK